MQKFQCMLWSGKTERDVLVPSIENFYYLSTLFLLQRNPISSSVSEQAPKKQQFHTPVTSSSDDSSESSSDESDRGCTRVYIIPQRRHQHTSLSELHDSSCSSRASPSFARSRSSAVSFGSSEPGTSMPVRRTNRVRKPPDRYGEWQFAQQLGSECVYLETLV